MSMINMLIKTSWT